MNNKDKIKIYLENQPNFLCSLNNNSFVDMIGKLDLVQLEPYFKQLIFGQLNAFEICGFLHMDIHLGNLSHHKTNKKILKYKIDKHEYTIETDDEMIIMDFDRSLLMLPNELPPYKKKNLLFKNICQSLFRLLSLLEFKYQKNVDDVFQEAISDGVENYERNELSTMNSLYNKTYTHKEYIQNLVENIIDFINRISFKLYGHSFFPFYTLNGI